MIIDSLRLENARESDFIYTTRNMKRVTIDEILQTKFKLKDTIEIPIRGEQHTFVVEHIRPLDDGSKKVYFVAKNIFVRNKMDLEEINGLLDGIESVMPREFVEQLADFEHITSKGFEMTRRVNLLSLGNFQDTEGYCIGRDDVVFDGFRTEAERVKNFGSESRTYWTCTPWKGERSPNISNFTTFNSVNNGGNIGSYYYASDVLGVVPGFSILCFA